MAMFVQFTIICGHCRHNNRPHSSPIEGIRSVLVGEFAACNNCKKPFDKIMIPANRPMVKRVIMQIGAGTMHSRIELSDELKSSGIGV